MTTFHTQTERPDFLNEPTSEPAPTDGFTQALRDLDAGVYLRLPSAERNDLKTMRSIASDVGKRCTPPRKYSINKDRSGAFWAFWRDYEPDEAYPAGVPDHRGTPHQE